MIESLKSKSFDPLFERRKVWVDGVRADCLMLSNAGGCDGLIDPKTACLMPVVLDAGQMIFADEVLTPLPLVEPIRPTNLLKSTL